MHDTSEWKNESPAAYLAVVESQLQGQYRTTVAELYAENAVRACQLAGFSPRECVEWLARVEGLG